MTAVPRNANSACGAAPPPVDGGPVVGHYCGRPIPTATWWSSRSASATDDRARRRGPPCIEAGSNLRQSGNNLCHFGSSRTKSAQISSRSPMPESVKEGGYLHSFAARPALRHDRSHLRTPFAASHRPGLRTGSAQLPEPTPSPFMVRRSVGIGRLLLARSPRALNCTCRPHSSSIGLCQGKRPDPISNRIVSFTFSGATRKALGWGCCLGKQGKNTSDGARRSLKRLSSLRCLYS